MLAFSGYSAEADGATIGREVVHVLTHHGVPASWNGSPKSRIEIAPFVWQRRRVTKAPPGAGAAPAVPAPPPPPAVCGLCHGRGWVTLDVNRGSELCACKRR